MSTQSEVVGWGELINRKYGLSVALVCLAVFLHAIDTTIVATLVPEIVDDIGGVNILAWTVVLYEMGSILAGAASGLVAMRNGIRKPMVWAAIVFSVGCALGAIAPDMRVVLVGRILQGLGGGGLVALSFVSIGVMFPRRLMPRVMAAVSIVWGTSAFLGPLAGGLFVEFADWRMAFQIFAGLALGLAFWIFRSTAISAQSPSVNLSADRFPFARMLMLCLGIVCIAAAGAYVSALLTPVLVMCGVGALAWFLVLDGKSEQTRLLPKPAVGLRTPASAALTTIVCFTIATIAITVYGPLLVTRIHGTSVLVAGFMVAASSIGWSVAAVVVSGRSERFDAHTILVGMTILIISIAGFVFSVPAGPVWLIGLFAFLEGVGFGMSWTFILRRMTARSPPAESERISASIPTTQRFGYAVGAAFVGIVANVTGLDESSSPQEVAATARWIFLACIPFALVGWIAAYRFCRPSSDSV